MFELLSEKQEQLTVSYEGYSFNPASRIWKIYRERSLNISWVDEFLEENLASMFLKVLASCAQKFSAAHTHNQANYFHNLARHFMAQKGVRLTTVSAEALISYRGSLDREHEYYLGSLRSFLKFWVDLGYEGVDESVINLLDGWRLRGNIKGRAVQTLCPLEGPLSDLEFEGLYQALVDAFELNTLSLENFVLVQIFIATGRRPAQLADLKVKDFIDVQSKNGLRECLLNVPRRKQRGISWREQFKPFALALDLGTLINRYIEASKKSLLKASKDVALDNFLEFPFFPNWGFIENHIHTQGLRNIKTFIESPEVHCTAGDLSIRLNKVVSTLNISSERTGLKLRIFPTRLRRTLATRAAREGFGELVIAELLDHTDTQNARVYTENVPEHVDAINEAVARQLAPLAQAFAGVLVDREKDARRGDDLSSRVRCEKGNVGTCGHYGFCGALAPIACYTCRNFQPWLEGPHEEVLADLILERERVLQVTKDKTMAAINDRTILAVTQVIQNCEERRRMSLVVCHG